MAEVNDRLHGRKSVRGVVVSDNMEKTIVVRIERLVQHPRYKKFIRKYTKFYAHDEGNLAKTGDFVEIVQSRPLSKKKRWRLLDVVTKK